MKPSKLPLKRVGDDSALLSSVHAPAKKLKKLKKTNALKKDGEKGYDHVILSHFYPRVISLRQHLLERLPRTSRIRRRKLSSIGNDPNNQSEAAARIADFLDSTLIGVPETFKLAFSLPYRGAKETSKDSMGGTKPPLQSYKSQYIELSQMDESYVTVDGSRKKDIFCQSEIVDFCIWSIFEQDKSVKYPKHVICDGYERSAANRFSDSLIPDRPIPGLFLKRQNEQAQILKAEPWPQILSLLGQSGQSIMVEMILNCGIFTRLCKGSGNLFQVCGVPLGVTKLLLPPKKSTTAPIHNTADSDSDSDCPNKQLHTPIEIEFCRNRMMYGRAILTARETVKTGFRHLHVLNRYTLASQGLTKEDGTQDETGHSYYAYGDLSTVKIMAYIFPRQFGLHNVFTSKVDGFKTTQKFQDYTVRGDEINSLFVYAGKDLSERIIKVPKRLRGEAHRLVWRLQVLHKRCSYSQLIRYYCPTDFDKSVPPTAKSRKKYQMPEITLKEGESITDYSTPLHQVSAFCRAVLTKIIPGDFWGVHEDGKHNQAAVMQAIDRFIRLRRFEKMNLHQATQDIKLAGIQWLAPPALRGRKMSQTDRSKRLELLNEFVYYVFDSLLIPLVRSTFYVTETAVDKNHIFFFRHDIWRALSSPALTALKKEMFAEMPPEAAKVLGQRKLGFSALRLLPKARTMRPIMNLKRRQRGRNGRQNLEPSINALLKPLHSVLKLEQARNPKVLGSTLASVQDIFTRLREFREKLPAQLPRLYFVKVDVQGAFDSIPQNAVLEVLNSLPRETQYTVAKHVEVRQGAILSKKTTNMASVMVSGRPRRKWCSKAYVPNDTRTFLQCLEAETQHAGQPEDDKQTASMGRGGGIAFHGKMAPRVYTKKYLLNDLLQAHVQANIVKIGKKYYVQKQGIPQGSVLSSDLCNLFYARMEAQEFDFIRPDSPGSGQTLLMRLVDDSLLITTDQATAQRFAETMIRGVPAYGVTVNPRKTLANFECVVDGVVVPQLAAGEAGVPFCGTVINCRTLSISRLQGKTGNNDISQALTVEYSRNPGQAFQQRVLNFFRAYSHAMFYDSVHNTARIAYANLRKAMFDIARRTWAYIRSLPPARKPASRVVIRTIELLTGVVHSSVKSKTKSLKFPGYKCDMSRAHVFLLILEAFSSIFCPGKSRYREVVEWLNGEVHNAASVAAGRSRKRTARQNRTKA